MLLVQGMACGGRSLERVRSSGSRCLGLLCGILPHVHVESAHPFVAGLDQQGRDQPQAGLFVGKDLHNSGPPFQLLVLALQYVGRPHALAMRLRHCLHAEDLFAIFFQQP